MNFFVAAFATVPDTETARRLFDLPDLDDKSVSKVLFHRRKQQTGSSEVLRWDQRSIAGMTLIEHRSNSVRIDSLTATEGGEVELLHAYFKAALAHGHMMHWNARMQDLPLLRFRALMHEVAYPAYWQAAGRGELEQFDVAAWLSPTIEDRPSLDKTARRLGFPGMLGHDDDAVYRAWLAGDSGGVQAFSDIMALNTYLVALRLHQVRGNIHRNDIARTGPVVRDLLRDLGRPHLAAFLDAWSD